MKEITRIITAQITQVYKTSDDEAEARIKRDTDRETTRALESYLKDGFFNADDVKVEIKNFVMDWEA